MPSLRGKLLPRAAFAGTLLLVFVLWAIALFQTDVRAMGDLGLITVLPWQFYAALLVLTLSFSLLVVRATRPMLLTGHMVAAVLIIHGTPTLLYGTLRYSWAWKHLGVIDYIQRHGAVDPTSTYLNAYQNWPGFFAWGAFVADAARLPDFYLVASLAPVYFNLLNLAALSLVVTAFTRDRRLLWLSLWFFLLASWVGQDYFAPQAASFFLFLVVLGVCLTWLNRRVFFSVMEGAESSEWRAASFPMGTLSATLARMPLTRAGLLLAAVLCLLAMVYTHQLTPIFGVLALTALAFFGFLTARTLPLLLAVLTIGWMAYGAHHFIGAHLSSVLEDLGRVDTTIETNLIGLSDVSRGQVIVSYFSRGLSALVVALAVAGLVRRLRHGQQDGAAVLLVLAAWATLPLSSYGGELLFRLYLFSVPFMGFLAAGVVFPSLRAGGSLKAAGAVALISALLLPAFLVAYYGKDHQYYFTPEEVAAANYVYTTAPPDSLLIEGSRNYPGQHLNYERFVYVPIAWEPVETRLEILRDPAGTLSSWMSNPGYAASYIIITRSQKAENDMFGTMPPGALDEIEAALMASPLFRVAFSNEDASVFVLQSQDPEVAQ